MFIHIYMCKKVWWLFQKLVNLRQQNLKQYDYKYNPINRL